MRERVLIVEDNKSLAKLIAKKMNANVDMDIVVAHSYADAINIIEDNDVINSQYNTLVLSLKGLYKLENKIIMKYDENNGEPYLLFDAAGGEEDSSHTMKLTTQRLSFLYNNDEIAYFGKDSMTIKKARVNQGIYLGTPSSGYLLIKTTEQGCAFIWEDSF